MKCLILVAIIFKWILKITSLPKLKYFNPLSPSDILINHSYLKMHILSKTVNIPCMNYPFDCLNFTLSKKILKPLNNFSISFIDIFRKIGISFFLLTKFKRFERFSFCLIFQKNFFFQQHFIITPK